MERPRLLTLHNGEKAKPTFSREEMERRIGKLRDYMGEQGIDSVLFTSIHNINYYADYVYCSFGRNYGLVITRDSHTAISANLDYGRPGRQAFGDTIAYTDWQKDNFFEAVKKLVPNRGRVGVEFDGREAGLEFREDVETELAPGMVVSMEPMITIPAGQEGAGGYREHDMLIVTEEGAENITSFPFGPEHNIVKA